jgi:lipopolysaccharide transport system permease protein
VLTNLANYVLSLPLLLGLGLLYGVTPTWHVVLLVPIVALQTFFTLALVYLLSSLNVAFRDLQHVVVNLVQMAFFLTPVLWPVEQLSPELREKVLFGNPMAAVTQAYRAIFYTHTMPELAPLVGVTLASVVMFWVAANVFERRREEFAELV